MRNGVVLIRMKKIRKKKIKNEFKYNVVWMNLIKKLEK